MSLHLIRPSFAFVAACIASGLSAAQPAPEGTLEWQLCFGGPLQVVSPAPQVVFGTYAVTGAVRTAGALAESLTLECLGSFDGRQRAPRSQGYCVYQNPAGDRIYGADNRSEQGYTWTFYGGTGVYAGISGSGTIEVTAGGPPIRPGTLQGCRRVTGSYRIAR